MSKREKRLENGIASLEEKKALHEKKLELAKSLGQTEIVRYYTKEIASFEERKKDREEKLKRKE
jgi:hypothetical protein